MTTIPVDKAAHAGVSGGIVVAVTAALTAAVGPHWAMAIGVAVALSLGILKEVIDSRADAGDITADVIGALVAVALLLLFAWGIQAWTERQRAHPEGPNAPSTTDRFHRQPLAILRPKAHPPLIVQTGAGR